MFTYLYTYMYLYILPHHVLCVMHREPGSGGSWVPADTTEDTGHDFSKFPSPPWQQGELWDFLSLFLILPFLQVCEFMATFNTNDFQDKTRALLSVKA